MLVQSGTGPPRRGRRRRRIPPLIPGTARPARTAPGPRCS
jgi:hypothetical protein